jgi:hypothetical protein
VHSDNSIAPRLCDLDISNYARLYSVVLDSWVILDCVGSSIFIIADSAVLLTTLKQNAQRTQNANMRDNKCSTARDRPCEVHVSTTYRCAIQYLVTTISGFGFLLLDLKLATVLVVTNFDFLDLFNHANSLCFIK